MDRPIESYAVIGDCETAALVGRDGSVDWLCWPRFDSDSTFGALLGSPEAGRWLIGPDGGGEASSRRYRPGTLVLETCFETADGAVKIVDFMPPRGTNSDVVRLVCGTAGRVTMRMDLSIRFGYGAVVPWVRRLQCEEGTVLQALAGPDMVVLHAPVPLRGEDMHTVSTFEVAAGEVIPFVLTYGSSYGDLPTPINPNVALEDTEAFWREWSERSDRHLEICAHLDANVAETVRRSLVTLKALTYAPSGGIVAAATTSLPERLGGERNWDYRYCWLRDATMTLLTLMNAGYYEEAGAWRDWLLRAVAGSPDQIQIMYGVAGERRLEEWSVPWLPGYEHSAPVRVGNAASNQLQLDVYGEVMDALYQARRGGLPENDAAWGLQRALLDSLEAKWHEPDEGMWEVRSGRRHFTYSKVMAWVAFDRGIRSARDFGIEGPVDRWCEVRDRIRRDVLAHGYSRERGSFVQSYGTRHVEANLLLLPTLGFVDPLDERYLGTVRAVEADLLVDGHVRRYRTEETSDGLSGGEGAFVACSFWLVDAYAMTGRLDEARALFAKLAETCNDVGLMAEQYDPLARRQLGNVPQAFSHMALVDSAFRLARASAPTEPDGRRPRDREADVAPGDGEHGRASGGSDRIAAAVRSAPT